MGLKGCRRRIVSCYQVYVKKEKLSRNNRMIDLLNWESYRITELDIGRTLYLV